MTQKSKHDLAELEKTLKKFSFYEEVKTESVRSGAHDNSQPTATTDRMHNEVSARHASINSETSK